MVFCEEKGGKELLLFPFFFFGGEWTFSERGGGGGGAGDQDQDEWGCFSLPLDSFRTPPPPLSFFLESILVVFAASSRFWGKVVMGMF